MLYISILSFVIILIFTIITLWVYLPGIPYISDYSSIGASFFPAYLLIISSVIFLWTLLLYLNDKNTFNTSLTLLTVWLLFATIFPIYSVMRLSHNLWTPISLFKNLDVVLNRAKPDLKKSVLYSDVEGKKLYMDVTKAKNISQNIKPLIFVHGGGFTSWERNEEPVWTEYFTERWFTVFDVSYRLADYNYHTYNKAARDITTAMVFIQQNKEKYNLNMEELVLAGSSAGASLALQASYGEETIFPANIKGILPKVKKVVALFPATDMAALWYQDTSFIGINSREVGKQYVGGSPDEFPAEYEMINSAKLAQVWSPETLVIHGLSDTLIPATTLHELESTLDRLDVANTFVYIPYAVHGFTYFKNTLAFQMSREIVSNFLNIQK